ncbi:hypothetical protein [Streptomyces sp. MZ04]|uniref:hypothetical protein n=1 Tax=Streptomyces sp. MZ04 TaxID=2559236 RepID=UPI00107E9551|nr:hypothetical protein [Streptomyces sp. MZ04]TGA85690.1 hypothetical protein E2651_41680 [Streptomyces sp. MZ04]
MPWDEWERLKAEAGDRDTTRTQLNGLPATGVSGSGDQYDLVVEKDDLGLVGHEAFMLHDHLRKQADIAGAGADRTGTGSTMQAAATLKGNGFAMGEELATTVEMWTSQVKAVLQACAHISNHLDFSKKLHAENDAWVEAAIKGRDGSAIPVSRLHEYFK